MEFQVEKMKYYAFLSNYIQIEISIKMYTINYTCDFE